MTCLIQRMPVNCNETRFCENYNSWENSKTTGAAVDDTLDYIYGAYFMNSVCSDSMPIDESPLMLSGGLQQYLIRHRPTNISPQPRKGCGSDSTTFHDLPDSIQLAIFSFLDARCLCQISTVCQHWEYLSLDEILWQRRLAADIDHWHVVGHLSNPDVYKDTEEMTTKDIYIRCSPMIRQIEKQSNFLLHRISGILRSLWPYKTPKLAMFGPGLESETGNLVRNLLEGKCEKFKAVAMFPGQFDGVGGGFTLQMNSCLTFDLITLYTATKKEREKQSLGQRAQNNRLLVHGEVAHDSTALQPAVKDLCRTLNGLIFVTDSTCSADEVCMGRSELFAMADDNLMLPDVPVLILSCTPTADLKTLSCITVTRLLQLKNLNRPWQVHDCIVDGMKGAEEAFQWIIEACRRK